MGSELYTRVVHKAPTAHSPPLLLTHTDLIRIYMCIYRICTMSGTDLVQHKEGRGPVGVQRKQQRQCSDRLLAACGNAAKFEFEPGCFNEKRIGITTFLKVRKIRLSKCGRPNPHNFEWFRHPPDSCSMSRKRLVGGMALYLMPPLNGSSGLSHARYAWPPTGAFEFRVCVYRHQVSCISVIVYKYHAWLPTSLKSVGPLELWLPVLRLVSSLPACSTKTNLNTVIKMVIMFYAPRGRTPLRVELPCRRAQTMNSFTV